MAYEDLPKLLQIKSTTLPIAVTNMLRVDYYEWSKSGYGLGVKWTYCRATVQLMCDIVNQQEVTAETFTFDIVGITSTMSGIVQFQVKFQIEVKSDVVYYVYGVA